MKRIICIVCTLFCLQAHAQWAVTDPALEATTILNHTEQMQQAVQSYQSIVRVQQGVEKGIEAIERVNSQLMTIRDVQEVANRTGLCIRRIQKTYDQISAMKLDARVATDLLSQCNQCIRECVNLSAYGAKIFTNNFLKMSDKDRLDETRKLLGDIDMLLSRVNNINTQAKAIQFNNEMINSYFH